MGAAGRLHWRFGIPLDCDVREDREAEFVPTLGCRHCRSGIRPRCDGGEDRETEFAPTVGSVHRRGSTL